MQDYVYVYDPKEVFYQALAAPSRPERRRPYQRALKAVVAALQFWFWLKGI